MRQAFFVLSLLLLLLYAVRSSAQAWTYRQYTAEQGLPSTEVYDIIQDRKGYIWAATDRGVARFDGYSFESFTTAEGLNNNTVFRLHEGPDGKIWFGEMPGTLSYYEQGAIHSMPGNDEIRKCITPGSVPHCIIARKEYIDIGYTDSKPLRVQNGKVKMLYPDDRVRDIVSMQGNDVLFSTGKRAGPTLIDGYGKHLFFQEDRIPTAFRLHALKRWNGELLVTVSGTVRIFDTSGLRKKYLSNCIRAFFETTDSCLFAVPGKGFYYYAPGETYTPGDRYLHLKDCSVSKIIKDKEGGLWVSTLNKGIFYCPSTAFRTYDLKEDFGAGSSCVYGLCGDNKGKVFVRLEEGGIFYFHKDKAPVCLTRSNPAYGYIYYDTVHQRLLANLGDSIDPLYRNEVPALFMPSSNGIVTYKQGYLNGHYSTLNFHFHMPRKGLRRNQLYLKKAPGIQCMLRLTDDSIFAGTLRGLYLFRDDSLHPMFARTLFKNERINDIECIDKRVLVLATIGRGLFLYDLVTGATTQLTKREGLVSDVINDAALAGDGSIWLAGNRGISRLHKNAGGQYDIRNYTSDNGIPTGDIKKLHIDGNTLYMGSHIGLTLLDTRNTPIDHDPGIELRSVHVNGRSVQPAGLRRLAPEENNLNISFLSIIPRMQGRVLYRFRLDAADRPGNWVYIREPHLLLSAVEPGSYTITIQANYSMGQWSKAPLVLSVHIALPFWKTWWFITCCLSAAGGIIAWFQSARMKRLRKRTADEKLMLNYQQQALINQVNPHFVFNSMNSIQKYILREDKEKAVSFVAKFAKLMRLGLEHSREEFILLRKELELLQVYMLLEKERFDKKITYTVDIQAGLEQQHIMVPPMLIQPFLENALKHGILNKETGGVIILRVYRNNDLLFCEVEDDGVGRTKVAQILQGQSLGHRSFATSINTSRLQLLSQSLRSDYLFEVTDKSDQFGNAAGTLIRFIIPFRYEHSLYPDRR